MTYLTRFLANSMTSYYHSNSSVICMNGLADSVSDMRVYK